MRSIAFVLLENIYWKVGRLKVCLQARTLIQMHFLGRYMLAINVNYTWLFQWPYRINVAPVNTNSGAEIF